jgi:hypothetical protein
VVSEFQEEGYFGRKSRYNRGVLVEGRGADRGADDGMEIYSFRVLIFINGIFSYKSGLSDSNSIYSAIIKIK